MIEERPASPAPDPPTKGWWIDPEDPTMIRRHNGKRWTGATIRRYVPKQPERQGLFLLGTGKEGIPTGAPLAEARGRYLGKLGIWAGILAICGGFAAMWIGVNHDLPALGYPGLAVIAAMFSFFAITAWRAGLRPPLWGEKRVRGFFYGWLALVGGAGLGFWIAPVLPRDSLAYDWTNRVGIILVDGAVCAIAVYCTRGFLFAEREPGDTGSRWAVLLASYALVGFFLWRTWDRLMDALWIS